MKKYLFIAWVAMACGVYAQNEHSLKSKAEVYNDGKHKGLDFSVNTGYHVGVGNAKGGGSIPVELSLGKQFIPNLYLGVGAGAWVGTKGSSVMIPITLDSKVMFPSSTSSLKPLLHFRLGYLLNTKSDKDPYTQTIQTDYGPISQEMPGVKALDFVMMEIMPGIQFPMSTRMDFMLSAGYTHNFSTEGGGGSGYFSVKAGINFHKNPYHPQKAPREKVDTRKKGVQFTLEGGMNFLESIGGGGNLVCTYKFNPHFSVGGGIGYERISFGDSEEGKDIQIVTANNRSNNIYERYINCYGGTSVAKVFARGVYRVIDKRFSPFVSLDCGIRMCSFGDDLYTGDGNPSPEGDRIKSVLGDPKSTGFFVAPALGVSLRTTKNSYIDLKVGYLMTPGLEARKGYSQEHDGSFYASSSSKGFSNPFLSIGFTHTFGKRGKRVSL